MTPLLIELLTEELPPKALNALGTAFANSIEKSLKDKQLVNSDVSVQAFATPRRLAVLFNDVANQAPEQSFSEKLMPSKIGLDANGQASAALLKKLAAKNLSHLSVNDLQTESDGKQDYLVANGQAPGAVLAEQIQEIIETALTSLPIPKMMRYQLADGNTHVKFVRPAHSLIVLHGDKVLPASILGLSSSNQSKGHRFLGAKNISITSPLSYEEQLSSEGKVVASFEKRSALIREQLDAHASSLNASLGNEDEVLELLNEVTALVEFPKVYVGKFEEKFLAIPQECLILTMRLNQKYFPLFEANSGKLRNQFLIVSNMDVADPHNIIEGNERVIRPRLSDAEFFFMTDRKTSLESRIPGLENIVYHNKLGTQTGRIERLRKIASYIAKQLNANIEHADRAALLAKADLSSTMVGEFPELQGIIGAYYAQAGGEPAPVVEALRQQYNIRFDQAINDDNLIAAIYFIADRTETLVGIWGIGLQPTGERDPFALRRAALGVISAFEQINAAGHNQNGALNVADLLQFSFALFADKNLNPNTVSEVQAFIYERYRNQLISKYERSAVEAVLALTPPLNEVIGRVEAVSSFMQMDEAASLAAANKRIGNLLKKVEGQLPAINEALFSEAAEKDLAKALAQAEPAAISAVQKQDFEASLKTMALVRDAVDAFFADVMVMAEDMAVRQNRLALLSRLHQIMNLVSDISKLAA